MALMDDETPGGGTLPVPPTTAHSTEKTPWIDVSGKADFEIVLTVRNLGGTDLVTVGHTPSHKWSVEQNDTPFAPDGGTTTTLFADTTFTEVTVVAAAFPNVQRKRIAPTGDATASKDYIRAVITLAGDNVVSSYMVETRKIAYPR